MEKVTGTALGLATAGHRENIIRGVGGRCSGRYSVVKCAVGNEIYSGSRKVMMNGCSLAAGMS